MWHLFWFLFLFAHLLAPFWSVLAAPFWLHAFCGWCGLRPLDRWPWCSSAIHLLHIFIGETPMLTGFKWSKCFTDDNWHVFATALVTIHLKTPSNNYFIDVSGLFSARFRIDLALGGGILGPLFWGFNLKFFLGLFLGHNGVVLGSFRTVLFFWVDLGHFWVTLRSLWHRFDVVLTLFWRDLCVLFWPFSCYLLFFLIFHFGCVVVLQKYTE